MRAIAPLAIACLLLTGCAGGGAATATPTPGGPATPSTAATARAPGPTPSPSPDTGVVRPQGDPVVASAGLQAPWSFVWFDEDTILISERDTNRILERLPDGSLRVAATIGDVDDLGGEGGLLGMAIDDRHRLYVYSTGANGNRIQRFDIIGAPGSLALGPATTLIDGIPRAWNHNGGRLAFGPDGMLYAGTGDAAEGAATAQDLGSLGGKILRMTPDGAVPPDNPFPGSYVWSYGHRNVQGLAWGPDGTMYASEFGQDTWDELNVIRPGCDYGWPIVEGIAGDPRFCDPVQQWPTSEASPSGIVVAKGSLFIANLRGEVLRMVPLTDLGAHEDFYQGVYGRLRAVAVGPDGWLWFLTNNTDGRGDPVPGEDRLMAVPLA